MFRWAATSFESAEVVVCWRGTYCRKEERGRERTKRKRKISQKRRNREESMLGQIRNVDLARVAITGNRV